MNAYTKDVLIKFGSSNIAQAILKQDRTKLMWYIEKYNLQVPSTKEINANVAAFVVEHYKAA